MSAECIGGSEREALSTAKLAEFCCRYWLRMLWALGGWEPAVGLEYISEVLPDSQRAVRPSLVRWTSGS